MSAPRLDLKFRLSLRVVALAALCFAVAAAYVLFETDRAARARADWIAEVVAKDLALQQGQSHWIKGAPIQFPDLQRIAAAMMAPGLCIAYRAQSGEMLQRLCSGAAPGDTGVAAALRRSLPAPFRCRPRVGASRQLRQGGARRGRGVDRSRKA